MTKNKFHSKISQNNLGNQEINWGTQFSTIGGPVGDP